MNLIETNEGYLGKDIIIEDAKLIYRNFRGEGGRFNHEGDKNFNLKFDEEDVAIANRLNELGWKVKIKTREMDDGSQIVNYIMKVNVSYRFKDDKRRPKTYLYCDGIETELFEDTVNVLDDITIEHCDLRVAAFPYTDRDTGETFNSAYLKDIRVYASRDYLSTRAADYMSRFESPEE